MNLSPQYEEALALMAQLRDLDSRKHAAEIAPLMSRLRVLVEQEREAQGGLLVDRWRHPAHLLGAYDKLQQAQAIFDAAEEALKRTES